MLNVCYFSTEICINSICFKDDRKVEYANKVQELEKKREMEQKIAKERRERKDKQKVSNCLVIELQGYSLRIQST